MMTRRLFGIATVVAHSQSADHNPGLVLQGPNHYSLTVGDVKVTALSDGTVPQDLHDLLQVAINAPGGLELWNQLKTVKASETIAPAAFSGPRCRRNSVAASQRAWVTRSRSC